MLSAPSMRTNLRCHTPGSACVYIYIYAHLLISSMIFNYITPSTANKNRKPRWTFPRIGGYPSNYLVYYGFSILNHPFWVSLWNPPGPLLQGTLRIHCAYSSTLLNPKSRARVVGSGSCSASCAHTWAVGDFGC